MSPREAALGCVMTGRHRCGMPSYTVSSSILGSINRNLTSSGRAVKRRRSEEHTSELQSQSNLVCRLLLEKKKKHIILQHHYIQMRMNTARSSSAGQHCRA